MMVRFDIVLVFSLCLNLSIIVHECQSWTQSGRNRCPTWRIPGARVKLRSNSRIAKVTCNWPFVMVHGNEITACVSGEWNGEKPICARTGCPITEEIDNGRLNVLFQGAKLEVVCDFGYSVEGPSFIYCNDLIKWNDNLKGCKASDHIFLSCDFESSDERFCGWKNDPDNNVDWIADKTTISFFSSRHHVAAGSSQYFLSNYISMDAGNYGPIGRLISPPFRPVKVTQTCLIFSYRVTVGTWNIEPSLTVYFGGIPHWNTSKGEGRAVIGLYKLNATSNIVIEGKSCKAAIDNIVITQDDSCTQQPYEEESETCHDNCGIIKSGSSCSCDWECYHNNNCCPDIIERCPNIKSTEEIDKLYFTSTTASPPTTHTVVNYINSTVTVSTMKYTSNTFNETKVSNDSTVATTAINNYNVIIGKITPSNITPIPIPNITYATFTPTLPTVSPPTTITVTARSNINTSVVAPSNNISIKINTIQYLHDKTNSTTATSLTEQTSKNISSVTINNTTVSVQFITTPVTTIKPSILNTTNIVSIIVPNTTAVVNETFITMPNSTTKQITENTTIIATKLVINTRTTPEHFTVKTTFINKKLINFSNKTAFKTANNTNITITLPMRSNITKHFNQSVTKSTTEPPNTYTRKTIPYSPILEKLNNKNESSTLVPYVIQYSNDLHNTSDKQLAAFDIDVPNKESINPNSSKSFKTNYNKNYPITTIKYTNHSELKYTPFWKNITFTKSDTLWKQELNYSFHNDHKKEVDGWLTNHEKQNGDKKSSQNSKTVFMIKIFTAIGFILVTFKIALFFIKKYFNRLRNDEMDACFLESDKESSCNLELISN